MNLQAFMKWNRTFDGEAKGGLGLFLNVSGFFIFSGVCMHTSAALEMPQVDTFWWEHVPVGNTWPVLVVEETNLLLLANTFLSSTCGDGTW